uniref:Uncharacterized protein n=1 Tax=Oryza sativa subsp. japonica TaxID=39947 RepID=Q6YTQ1_ORYSJ|nr:hypothetical protein [Oryza sativa Japonica Group]
MSSRLGAVFPRRCVPPLAAGHRRALPVAGGGRAALPHAMAGPAARAPPGHKPPQPIYHPVDRGCPLPPRAKADGNTTANPMLDTKPTSSSSGSHQMPAPWTKMLTAVGTYVTHGIYAFSARLTFAEIEDLAKKPGVLGSWARGVALQ